MDATTNRRAFCSSRATKRRAPPCKITTMGHTIVGANELAVWVVEISLPFQLFLLFFPSATQLLQRSRGKSILQFARPKGPRISDRQDVFKSSKFVSLCCLSRGLLPVPQSQQDNESSIRRCPVSGKAFHPVYLLTLIHIGYTTLTLGVAALPPQIRRPLGEILF